MAHYDDQLKDWQFRYQYHHNKRHTNKQKQRFTSSFLYDVNELDYNAKVIEYEFSKNHKVNNIYIGSFDKADTIIATYYDTPLKHFLGYYPFDREKNKRNTFSYNLLTTFFHVLVGVVLVWFYSKNPIGTFKSWKTVIIAMLIYVFFYTLNKTAKGYPTKKTGIRNTSSILTILYLMNCNKGNKNIAFALIDDYTYGNYGLDALKNEIKSNSKIIFLDSIGYSSHLYIDTKNNIPSVTEFDSTIKFISENSTKQITWIFSAEKSNNKYMLKKEKLKKDEPNFSNIRKINKLIKKRL